MAVHHSLCADVCHPRWPSPRGSCLPSKLGTIFPSIILLGMVWLSLPQQSSVQSCQTLWKQGVGLSPSCPLLLIGLSLPLCQPCNFFPPGQAGLLLAGQYLLQSQVTSPPQKHFLVPLSCTHSVTGLMLSPHLCLLCHRTFIRQGLLLLAPGYPQHLIQNYACNRHPGLLSQVMNGTCLRVAGGLNQVMPAKNLGGLLGGSCADNGPGVLSIYCSRCASSCSPCCISVSFLPSLLQAGSTISATLQCREQSQSSPGPRCHRGSGGLSSWPCALPPTS